MIKNIVILCLLIFTVPPLTGGILLNEISTGGPSDWVEVKLTPDVVSMDISQLLVTMYYGTNEKIADSPVTLYGTDRPGTPWDDRFAVIHFTDQGTADETDSSGDLDSNSVRDLYCSNYGLWNTDCCLAIDSDDDPKNNGILDFAAFSNRDGSINSTIESYIKSAAGFSMWQVCTSGNTQDCCAFTGSDGMNSYSTLSRLDCADSNTLNDFVVTPYSTPGRENITADSSEGRHVLKAMKKTLTYRPRSGSGAIAVTLFMYQQASIRLRIFNPSGMPVYTGRLIADISPGYYTLNISTGEFKGRLLTGIYLIALEAVGSDSGKTESLKLKLVVIKD